MTVAYYFGPLEVSMAHWKDVVNALLCAQLAWLKKLNIVQVINHPRNKANQFWRASESIRRLWTGSGGQSHNESR